MRHLQIIRRRGAEETRIDEPCGGVFAPDAERGLTLPVYSFGPEKAQEPIFSCPVSALTSAVWRLLDLWWTCRTMRALPLAGGVVDQPVSVRRAFPIFEAEQMRADRIDESRRLALMWGAS